MTSDPSAPPPRSAPASPSATDPRTAPLRPRDAATLILVDRAKAQPRVLLGRRRDDMKFMPGKYVFPGGRVDKTDRGADSVDELGDNETAKLLVDMKGGAHPAKARALLAEAGYPNGFAVTLDCVNVAWREAVCQAATAMLNQVGIRAALRSSP